MLVKEILEIKSTRRERHQFGIVIAVAVLLVGGFLYWRGYFHAAFPIAAAVLLAPVLIDKLFQTDTAIILLPFQKVWMAIAVVLGYFVSRFILGVFFYGVFTTVRAVNRVVGKPLLDTEWDKKARDSYWIPRDADEYTPEHSERQY